MKPFAVIKSVVITLFTLAGNMSDSNAQVLNDTLLTSLLSKHPEQFSNILSNNNDLNVQIIYTQISQDKKGRARLTEHHFHTDTSQYFYPASTVKLPVAILALQRLHELNIPGLDLNSTMITGEDGDRQTEVCNDPTAPDGRPTIAHYIKKILLVSDNDAFNRLYEFLGQEYINNNLHKMGYDEVQIIHRLNVFLTEEENRHTNPVSFFDTSGRLLYQQPAVKSRMVYADRNTRMGKGYMRGDVLVNEPFDFSKKNRMSLQTLHSVVTSIMFPEAMPKEKQFNLTDDDYAFLRRYMSMLPSESKWPQYDTSEVWDTYVKFLYYGAEKGSAEPGIRSFNKPGDAYGFLTDAAYIADFNNKTEFILSATIHCNSDGVYNDDHYDYDTVGLPFMKNIGRLIAAYEMTRTKKYKPSLSSILFSYRD